MPRFSVLLSDEELHKLSEMALLSVYADKSTMVREMIKEAYVFYQSMIMEHPPVEGKSLMGDWLGEAYNPACIKDRDEVYAEKFNDRYDLKIATIENEKEKLEKGRYELDEKQRIFEAEMIQCDECEYPKWYKEWTEENQKSDAQERFNRNVREVSVWPAWMYEINYKMVFLTLLGALVMLLILIACKTYIQPLLPWIGL